MHDYDLDNKRQYESDFRSGVVSKQAREYWKDYWYNEFKRQKIQSDSGQDQSLRNQPLKPSECFHGKSEHKSVFSPELIKKLKERGEELKNESVQNIAKMFCDTIKEEYPEALEDMGKEIKQYKDYLDYIKSNPDRPISFDNWKYMVEHYEKPELISKNDIDDVVNGKRPHYPYGTIQSDALYGATKKDFDDATPKHIGIIGHVDHGKTLMVGLGLRESQKGVIIMDMDTPLTPEERFEVMENLKPDLSTIKSIVPIADVIPEEIISKQEFLKMHDKAVERSITDETYRESRAWDIKKEKKVSHKRNNKRRK